MVLISSAKALCWGEPDGTFLPDASDRRRFIYCWQGREIPGMMICIGGMQIDGHGNDWIFQANVRLERNLIRSKESVKCLNGTIPHKTLTTLAPIELMEPSFPTLLQGSDSSTVLTAKASLAHARTDKSSTQWKKSVKMSQKLHKRINAADKPTTSVKNTSFSLSAVETCFSSNRLSSRILQTTEDSSSADQVKVSQLNALHKPSSIQKPFTVKARKTTTLNQPILFLPVRQQLEHRYVLVED
jgi:hypothetical protein